MFLEPKRVLVVCLWLFPSFQSNAIEKRVNSVKFQKFNFRTTTTLFSFFLFFFKNKTKKRLLLKEVEQLTIHFKWFELRFSMCSFSSSLSLSACSVMISRNQRHNSGLILHMTTTRENALIFKINTQLTEFSVSRTNAVKNKMRKVVRGERRGSKTTSASRQSGQKITKCKTKMGIKPKRQMTFLLRIRESKRANFYWSESRA